MSVNHAKGVPMSIATLTTSAKALESNAFLLFVFVIFNDIPNFLPVIGLRIRSALPTEKLRY